MAHCLVHVDDDVALGNAPSVPDRDDSFGEGHKVINIISWNMLQGI